MALSKLAQQLLEALKKRTARSGLVPALVAFWDRAGFWQTAKYASAVNELLQAGLLHIAKRRSRSPPALTDYVLAVDDGMALPRGWEWCTGSCVLQFDPKLFKQLSPFVCEPLMRTKGKWQEEDWWREMAL